MPKPTIVLVHGAWADASSWNAVASSLQSEDFTVFAPTNLLRGVSIDAPYIASFLAQRTSGPVVLVEHSYGGFVITNAATGGGDVRALVYIDAFAPDEGETTFSILGGSGSALDVPDPTTSPATPGRRTVTSKHSSSPTRCTRPSPKTCPRPTGGSSQPGNGRSP
jgi:pimeloyl-ACP methyl ester carboxylesterase